MKKKRLGVLLEDKSKFRKIFLIMKLNVILLFVFVHVVSAEVGAQAKITIEKDVITYAELFEQIKRQTGLTVMYSNSELNKNRSVEANFHDTEVREVLNKVLVDTGLGYEFLDEFIVLKVLPKQAEQKKEILVRGKISDESKYPLPGVTIRLKGLNVGTASDKDGKYAISFPEMDKVVLVFSFVGMETQEIEYRGQDTINVVMKESSAQLEEVVVHTGYQQIDPRKSTSAITTIKAADIMNPAYHSIDQMLEGHVPGMIFMQNSGQLGATPRLRIRGTSTIIGNQEPLWVVDGIIQHDPVNVDPSKINDFDFVNLLGNAISGLNPNDIEQIDVLKDASATAIYGARAANGVIVVTTKKGKAGPPTISYSLSMNFTQRPHYSDRSVNMMNSLERVALSRDLVENNIVYPSINSWVGYEAVVRDYWNQNITYEQMEAQVKKLETMNTDWFDILTRNAFSHKHDLSVSGGSSTMKYYASIGFDDAKGNAKGEGNKSYSANINLSANYNRFAVRFGMQANVSEDKYSPSDINLMGYAYNTSRAVPSRGEDGSLFYYLRSEPDVEDTYFYYPFNIIEDMENSSYDINSNKVSLTLGVDYKIIDPLKFGITLSYTAANTYQDEYHGEKTYFAKLLRDERDGVIDPQATKLPFGGVLAEDNQRNNSYVVRGQLDFVKFLDKENIHQLVASVGGEISSNHYVGKKQTHYGYTPERGKQMILVDLSQYEDLAKEYSNNPELLGIIKDDLNRMASAYMTLSYNYKDYYMFNINGRIDGSNSFGNRSNDKLLPIWSVSGRWNVKEDILKNANWVTNLSLRASYGFQGNMLAQESPRLIIKRESMSPTMEEYASTIYKFPNPYLKWEKTNSMNFTLDFGFLNNRINGTFSYFYKKTKDAFMNKSVSEINGVEGYYVNRGTLENQGFEIGLNIIPVNTISSGNPEGFRWNFDPQLGQVFNKLLNKAIERKQNTFQDEDAINYKDYLNGSVEMSGEPLGTFYSYKFAGLDGDNGLPMFLGAEEYYTVNGKIVNDDEGNPISNYERMQDMTKEEAYMSVMKKSGTRVPVLQGGLVNTFSYKRFVLSFNLAYSLGGKVRLLNLYPDVAKVNGTIAPKPLQNVRKEFIRRWKKPGDEKRTNMPGIVSSSKFRETMSPWWSRSSFVNKFSENIWQMYDNSDLRVAKSDYLRLQSLSFRYSLPEKLCNKLYLKSCYVGFYATNLFTICDKKLKGQDPASQSGSSAETSLSLRPTYSLNLNISF